MSWREFDERLSTRVKHYINYWPSENDDYQRWAAILVEILFLDNRNVAIAGFNTRYFPPANVLCQALEALYRIKDRLDHPPVPAVAPREVKEFAGNERAELRVEINRLKAELANRKADVARIQREYNRLFSKYVTSEQEHNHSSVLAVTDLSEAELAKMTHEQRMEVMRKIASTAMKIRNMEDPPETPQAQPDLTDQLESLDLGPRPAKKQRRTEFKDQARPMRVDVSDTEWTFDRLMELGMGREPAQFMKEAKELVLDRDKVIQQLRKEAVKMAKELQLERAKTMRQEIQLASKLRADGKMDTVVVDETQRQALRDEFRDSTMATAIIDGFSDLEINKARNVAELFKQQEKELNKAVTERHAALERMYEMDRDELSLKLKNALLSAQLEAKRKLDAKMDVDQKQMVTDEDAKEINEIVGDDEFLKLLISSTIASEDLKSVATAFKDMRDRIKVSYKTIEKLQDTIDKDNKTIRSLNTKLMRSDLRLDEKLNGRGLVDAKMTDPLNVDHIAELALKTQHLDVLKEKIKVVVEQTKKVQKAILEDQKAEIKIVKNLRDKVALPLIRVVKTLAAVEGTNVRGFRAALKAVGVSGLGKLPGNAEWDKVVRDFELKAPEAYNRLARTINRLVEERDLGDLADMELKEIDPGEQKGAEEADENTNPNTVEGIKSLGAINRVFGDDDSLEGWRTKCIAMFNELNGTKDELKKLRTENHALQELADTADPEEKFFQSDDNFEEIVEVRVLRRPPFIGWNWMPNANTFFQVTIEPHHDVGYWLGPTPRPRKAFLFEGHRGFLDSFEKLTRAASMPEDALLMMMRHLFDRLLAGDHAIDLWMHQSPVRARDVPAKHAVEAAFRGRWAAQQDSPLYELFGGVKLYNCDGHWNTFGPCSFPLTRKSVLLLPFKFGTSLNATDFKRLDQADLKRAIKNLTKSFKKVWGTGSKSWPQLHIVLVCMTTQTTDLPVYKRTIHEAASEIMLTRKQQHITRGLYLTKTVIIVPTGRMDQGTRQTEERSMDLVTRYAMMRSLENCLDTANRVRTIADDALKDIKNGTFANWNSVETKIRKVTSFFAHGLKKACPSAKLFRAMAARTTPLPLRS